METQNLILCSKCNAGLGHFDDNLDFLRSALTYLEKQTGEI